MLYRRTVQEFQQGVEWRGGQIVRAVKPGVYWLWWGSGRRIDLFDTRAMYLHIPGQEVMLGDRTSLKINVAGSYKITNPIKLLREAAPQDLSSHLNQLVQLRVREVLGEKNLDDLLGQRGQVNQELAKALEAGFEALGLELVEAKIKDVILPSDLRAAYTESLAAQLRGKAQLEQARSQSAALRSLANTADLMEKHPQLVQLMSLQKDGAKLNLFFESAETRKAPKPD